jgi:hypothetical protein
MPQCRSGRGDEEKSICPCRASNSGRPTCSLDTMLTELSRFLGFHTYGDIYSGSIKQGVSWSDIELNEGLCSKE